MNEDTGLTFWQVDVNEDAGLTFRARSFLNEDIGLTFFSFFSFCERPLY